MNEHKCHFLAANNNQDFGERLIRIEEHGDSMGKDVKVIREVLLGNGDIDKSLVMKVQSNTLFRKLLTWAVTIVFGNGALVAVLTILDII